MIAAAFATPACAQELMPVASSGWSAFSARPAPAPAVVASALATAVFDGASIQ